MLIFNAKIQEAIDLASKAHNGQKRKIGGAPYVVHPLAVGLILARIGADEETIIAGVLHDVLEDSKMEGFEEMILEKFGKKVLWIVKELTENKKLPWKERKQSVIDHISEMHKEALLVKSADVLHNIADLVFHIQIKGKRVFRSFSATKEEMFGRYKKLTAKLKKTWKENPLLPDLQNILKKLNCLLEKEA